MLDPTRQNLIKKLSELRNNSKVITYLTGDRVPLNTQIADDVIPIFQHHLINNRNEKISLFLYTRGGNMIAPLKIINFLRAHCNKLEVLVPHFAHSAGTLITLGADVIVMSHLGELSPVDPTTTHPFNPLAPAVPGVPSLPRSMSVEDVNSYFLLAKKLGIRAKDIEKVYSYLINNPHKENIIHPLALGNIFRGYRLAKILADRLLKFHIKGFLNRRNIPKIVEALTGGIPTHDYPIYRDEAESLGLNIENASIKLEEIMMSLLNEYIKIMEIGKPFNPLEILGKEEKKEFEYKGAFIESEGYCSEFIFKGIIIKEPIKEVGKPPKIGMNIISSKWETNK